MPVRAILHSLPSMGMKEATSEKMASNSLFLLFLVVIPFAGKGLRKGTKPTIEKVAYFFCGALEQTHVVAMKRECTDRIVRSYPSAERGGR